MGLTAEQKRVAQAIVRRGRRRGATAKELKAAIETGLVESNLRNVKGGDGTSTGWRQETASSYPGKNRNNVNAAADRFFNETRAVRGKYKKAGDLAQAVQRSAFPGRYKQRGKEAQQILRSIDRGGGGGGGSSGGGSESLKLAGVDRSDQRKKLVAQYLINQPTKPDPDDRFGVKQSTNLLTMLVALKQAQDTPGKTLKTGGSGRSSGGGGSGRRGHVSIPGSADRPGVKTNRKIKVFAQKVAGVYGHPLTVGTGTRHNRLTVNGNVSDHWSGNAVDIPARGEALVRLGHAALIAAGMNPKQARKQKGGLFNVGGHQIIFNTHEGGDHTNHLHISAR